MMKKAYIRILALMMGLCMLLSACSVLAEEADANVMAELSDTQRNSVGLLNYLSFLSKEINARKNNRLYIDEAYSSLYNNTYMNAIDEDTLYRMTNLMDTMTGVKMLSVKRERLDYIHQQEQAQAIWALVPSPFDIMNIVEAANWPAGTLAVLNTVVESYVGYESSKAEADLSYLQSGWELDDQEMELLNENYKDSFSYMWKIVNQYDLPGDLALNEVDIERFVKWKNTDNVVGRIQFLESNQSVYQGFGEYWLVLTESYYQNGDYDKCLQAIQSYEQYSTRIFRKDYHYARVLPMVITAASNACDNETYIEVAGRCADRILANSDPETWSLRYFAACTYIDIADRTGDPNWMKKAYDVVLDNVNVLVQEQVEKNREYLLAENTVSASKDASDREKKEINEYNNGIKAERKTEMPPVSAALTLNIETLYSLADHLQVSDAERTKIQGILYGQGDLFLSASMNAVYQETGAPELTAADIEPAFDGMEIRIPTSVLTENAKVDAGVLDIATGSVITLDDWTVKMVERANPADPSTFVTVYHSKKAESISYAEGCTAWINLNVTGNENTPVLKYNFTAYSKVDFLIPYIVFKLAE